MIIRLKRLDSKMVSVEAEGILNSNRLWIDLQRYHLAPARMLDWYMCAENLWVWLSPMNAEETHQRFRALVSQFFPQKLNHSLEPVWRRDFEEILLHYWRISDSFEPDDDWWKHSQILRVGSMWIMGTFVCVFLLVSLQRFDGLFIRLWNLWRCPWR